MAHVTVAEEGNRRRGEMNSSEISQSILDIKSWFIRVSKRKPQFSSASTVDIQRLEKAIDTPLPSPLKILLQECDGGLYFMDKKQLSSNEIMDAVSRFESSKGWRHGMIPFCGDESNCLVIDTTKENEILEWDVDEGVIDSVSSNLVRYLETYRNDLLENHFEFIEDVGVVEKMSKSSSAPHK